MKAFLFPLAAISLIAAPAMAATGTKHSHHSKTEKSTKADADKQAKDKKAN